mgnify:CR=1 FL=1
MEKRLRHFGIHSVERLCFASRSKLREVWGSIEGERFHDRLHGELVEQAETQRGTVGHSHVLSPEFRNAAGVNAVLKKLLMKAAMRLRSYTLLASRLNVRVKYIGNDAWEAAERMARRTLKKGDTLGADKGYDTAEHIKALKALQVKPHVAAKKTGSAMNPRTVRSKGYRVSLRKRKLVEEAFGWAKTVGGFRKTRFIGTAKVHAQALLTFAAYNLTRDDPVWLAGGIFTGEVRLLCMK